MTFKLFELSSFLGRPVCLYEFRWGNTYYRYTSADRDIEYPADSGTIYSKLAIRDSGYTIGNDRQDFVVTLPRNNPIVELFRSTPPSNPITLKCRRFHRDDPDEEATVYWVGTIGNVRGVDPVTSEILGLPISMTLRRIGLRKCWEVGCNNVLYDEDCKVDPNDFRVDTEITALTGTTVSVLSLGAFPPARYAGGFLEWQATVEGTIDRRSIEGFVGGTTLLLFGTTDRLEVGFPISLYLGCDLTTEVCTGTFDNLANYGGHKKLARKSPFDGNPVF